MLTTTVTKQYSNITDTINIFSYIVMICVWYNEQNSVGTSDDNKKDEFQFFFIIYLLSWPLPGWRFIIYLVFTCCQIELDETCRNVQISLKKMKKDNTLISYALCLNTL